MTILICAVVIAPVKVLAAEATVNLGSTANFAILAGSTVTNTGSTVISGSAGGNVGLSPGTAVTGFPPGTISDGTIHASDATAILAMTDLGTAYDDAAGRSVTTNLSGQDLGGMTLTSGVYKFDTAAQLTGELMLDAEGDPDAAFIFQIGSTLTTANASSIVLINEAQYCRVFWQVGSSATLGTDSSFIGHIFAMTSITATTGAEIQGQLLARTGAVTLDSNIITNGVCAAVTSPPVVVDEEDEPDEPTETPNPPAIVTPPAVVTPTPTPVAIVTTPAPVAVDVAADADVPQTGVSNSSGLFIGLMLLSVAGVVAATRVRSKAR